MKAGFAVTLGSVMSNVPMHAGELLRHERQHVLQNRLFGPLYTLTYLGWMALMLSLFGGTASLPHILIRYYTVKDQASARKSTIVGIASIGFFYILTMFLGLGAMTTLAPMKDTTLTRVMAYGDGPKSRWR